MSNRDKCTYCREYGNLPCEKCKKKAEELQKEKAMSKTKYIKVEVSDRLPQASGNYWITDTVGDMKHSFFNATLKSFPAYDFVESWVEPVPDREEEMIEMLEEGIAHLNNLDWQKDMIVTYSNWTMNTESLLQSLKQEK